jgi:Ca2+-binding EF-hand superfamily protein
MKKMTQKLSVLAAVVFGLGGAACGGNTADSDLLVENAAFSAALTSGDAEERGDTEGDIDGVPEGDTSAAADESAGNAGGSGDDAMRDCSLPGIGLQIRKAYDADGDGKLSETERQALAQDFGPAPKRFRRMVRFQSYQRLMWIYAGDDKVLSDAERQEMRNDLETRCENRKAMLLKQFDTDKDGALSDTEWQAAVEQIKARIQARWQNMLATHDKNGDGNLSMAERQAMAEALRQQFEARRQAMITQFDADKDGSLNATERAALREHLKARVRGEHFPV